MQLDKRYSVRYNAAMKVLYLYLAVINLIAFGFMAADKRRAQKHRWRIPEHTLFAAALLEREPWRVVGHVSLPS